MKLLKILGFAGLLLAVSSCSTDKKTEQAETGDTKKEAMKSEDAQPEVETAVKIGYKAPDFELINQNGETARLSDYSGKNIVLVFSRAHW